MSQFSPLPDPKIVRSSYMRGLKSQIIRIALLLDVFSPLANGPADAQTVAEASRCSVTGIDLLLNYLSSVGLLTKSDGIYELTPTSAAFLVPSELSYAGEWVLEQTDPEIFQEVLQSLRTGAPFKRHIPWEQLAWLESYDTSRIADSRLMWRAAGISPGQHAGLHVLDLACGCGIMSFVLAQADPTVRVTCVDSRQVLTVAEDLAGRLNIAEQVTFIQGDIHQFEPAEGSYDAVLLGNVTNFFTSDQNLDLFRRTWRALTPEGTLVINVTMAYGQINGHIGLYSLLLWALSGTEFYTFVDYHTWLKQAGFTRIDHLSKLWLAARKEMRCA